MTGRIWREGDPMPADHPPLVDNEGVVWRWGNDWGDYPDDYSYERQIITHYPAPDDGPGVAVGPPVGLDWDEILVDYGDLREATLNEARIFTHKWVDKPLGVSDPTP